MKAPYGAAFNGPVAPYGDFNLKKKIIIYIYRMNAEIFYKMCKMLAHKGKKKNIRFLLRLSILRVRFLPQDKSRMPL